MCIKFYFLNILYFCQLYLWSWKRWFLIEKSGTSPQFLNIETVRKPVQWKDLINCWSYVCFQKFCVPHHHPLCVPHHPLCVHVPLPRKLLCQFDFSNLWSNVTHCKNCHHALKFRLHPDPFIFVVACLFLAFHISCLPAVVSVWLWAWIWNICPSFPPLTCCCSRPATSIPCLDHRSLLTGL